MGDNSSGGREIVKSPIALLLYSCLSVIFFIMDNFVDKILYYTMFVWIPVGAAVLGIKALVRVYKKSKLTK